MLVVRGTKKLRDRLKGPVAGDGDVSTGMLGDWFATVLFWKPQVALLVNARTFLPVFMPLAPAGKLLDRLPDEIARILALHGVDPAVIDPERDATAEVRVAPTNDRSVVGVMNEFAFLGERWFDGDLTALSLRMAGTPVGPLRSGDGFPDQALAALVGNFAPSAGGLAEVIPFPGTDLLPAASPAPKKARGAVSPVSEGVDSSRGAPSVFQLKVTLLNTKPPIWRRILVDGSMNLAELHEVIQAALGWWNCHLHEFEIAGSRYGIPDPDWTSGRQRTMSAPVTSTQSPARVFRSTTPTTSATTGATRSPSRRSARRSRARRFPTASVVAGRAHPRTAVGRGATRTSSSRSRVVPGRLTLGSTSLAPASTQQPSTRATSR